MQWFPLMTVVHIDTFEISMYSFMHFQVMKNVKLYYFHSLKLFNKTKFAALNLIVCPLW